MAGSVFNGVVGLLFALGTGAALGLSTALHGAGAITLGTIYLVFRYTGMLRQPLERLSRQMNSFQQATGGIVRVRDLLATVAQVADGQGATFPDGALSVELDGVSFAYEAAPVLRGVSFRIEPGEVLGLLGRTGSGKTTISRLLFRLHDPTEGAVQLGGTDVREARLDVLRGRVGLVTQDVQLFQGTLRENVALFNRSVPDARLREVFAELGLDEWLRALPAELDTLLGAGARGLSAGEAQLVALARVFLKDPGLVVLDEASSRLDPQTERLLERAVTRLLDGRTGVVIAHRLATVERADRILILEDGRVAELGRRADLARDPASRFARLLRAGMVEALA
jgi:ATP-binding cassette subfamily B protein